MGLVLREIPLTPQPQTFRVTLVNVTYVWTIKWNQIAKLWVVDIDDQNNKRILSGVPLVTGTNLLEQYGYLNFNFSMASFTDTDTAAPPTFDNLGSTSHLYVGVKE